MSISTTSGALGDRVREVSAVRGNAVTAIKSRRKDCEAARWAQSVSISELQSGVTRLQQYAADEHATTRLLTLR